MQNLPELELVCLFFSEFYFIINSSSCMSISISFRMLFQIKQQTRTLLFSSRVKDFVEERGERGEEEEEKNVNQFIKLFFFFCILLMCDSLLCFI